MARLVMFAAARVAAGRNADSVPGATVDDVIAEARQRYGGEFAAVVETCAIWVNGDPAQPDTAVGDDDEIAVLPPVSGG